MLLYIARQLKECCHRAQWFENMDYFINQCIDWKRIGYCCWQQTEPHWNFEQQWTGYATTYGWMYIYIFLFVKWLVIMKAEARFVSLKIEQQCGTAGSSSYENSLSQHPRLITSAGLWSENHRHIPKFVLEACECTQSENVALALCKRQKKRGGEGAEPSVWLLALEERQPSHPRPQVVYWSSQFLVRLELSTLTLFLTGRIRTVRTVSCHVQQQHVINILTCCWRTPEDTNALKASCPTTTPHHAGFPQLH